MEEYTQQQQQQEDEGSQHMETHTQQLQEKEKIEAAKEKADELLFQRMVSLFFWPTLMTLEKPAWWQVEDMQRRVQRLEAEIAEQKEARKRRQAATPKTPEKDVEETSEYIQEIVRKLREDIEKRQQCKKAAPKKQQPKPEGQRRGRKRKRPPEPDPAEEGSSEKPTETGSEKQGESSSEKQGEAVMPLPQSAEAESSPPAPDNTGEVVEASDTPSTSRSQVALTLNIAKKKVKLKRLNRSFNMKKLWEARKQGAAPPRKKREVYRNEYQPRVSRSRRSADQANTS